MMNIFPDLGATVAGFTESNINSLLTLLGVMVTAIFSFLAAKNARGAHKNSRETNDAVNHKHPDQPRLFDLAISAHEHALEAKERAAEHNSKLDVMGRDLGEVKKKVDRLEKGCPMVRPKPDGSWECPAEPTKEK